MTQTAVPFVFGHRGASAHAPENSLSAFALALSQGANGLECDAQLTADDQVIILHDETLDATTTGHGPVKDRSLAELRTLLLRTTRGGAELTEETIPTLAEVLERFGHGPHLLNVEIKPSRSIALAAKVAEQIHIYHSGESVLLSSFDVRALAYLAEHHPTLRRALNYPPTAVTRVIVGMRNTLGWLTNAAALGCEAVHPHWRLVNPAVVERAHALGLNLNVWTVDDARQLRHLAEQGVDGLITNDPAATLGILRQVTAS